MNQVSWLIYLSDVVGNLSVVFALFSVLGFILVAGLWVMAISFDTDYKYVNDKKVYVRTRYFPKAWIVATIITVVWFMFVLGAIFTPSKNAVLLIATSEFSANYLSSTDTGTEVTGLVQDTLKLLHNQVSAQLEHKDEK